MTKQRDDSSDSVQIADFKFWSGELCDTEQTPISVINPEGNSGTRTFENEKLEGYDEEPKNLIDDNPFTKWLDFNKKSLVFEFDSAAPAIRCYSWRTANDLPERDPVQWKVEGTDSFVWTGWSQQRRWEGDEEMSERFKVYEAGPWSLVDLRESDAPETLHRNTFLPKLPFTEIYSSQVDTGRFTSRDTFQSDPGSTEKYTSMVESERTRTEVLQSLVVTNSTVNHILINDFMVLTGSEADWAPCMSSVYTTTVAHTIVKAEPIDGSSEYTNAAAISGNIVYVERGGGVSFFTKAQRAEAAGATGVMIGQPLPSEADPCELVNMEHPNMEHHHEDLPEDLPSHVNIPVMLMAYADAQVIVHHTDSTSTFAMVSGTRAWVMVHRTRYHISSF